jgi:hypothetical protein
VTIRLEQLPAADPNPTRASLAGERWSVVDRRPLGSQGLARRCTKRGRGERFGRTGRNHPAASESGGLLSRRLRVRVPSGVPNVDRSTRRT